MYPKPLAENYELLDKMASSIRAYHPLDLTKSMDFLIDIESFTHEEMIPILERYLPMKNWQREFFTSSLEYINFTKSINVTPADS